MPRLPNDNQLEWETVEVPFAAGVDLRNPARAVTAPRLLALENGRFDEGVGVRKRRGHRRQMLRTSTSLASGAGGSAPGFAIPSFSGTGQPQGGQVGTVGTLTPPDGWLYGVGPSDGTTETAASPDADFCAGMAKRDNEVLAWDGHRLYSWNAAQGQGQGLGFFGTAMMPSARTETIAKTGTSQRNADIGVGDNIIVVAWYPDGSSDTYVSVYDYTTRAPLLLNHLIRNNPTNVRVMPMGEWVHILVADGTANELRAYSIHESKPWTVSTMSAALGTMATYFDCRKINDDLWAVVKRTSANELKLTYLDADGSTNTTFCDATTNLSCGSDALRFSFDVHPQTGEVGVVFSSNAAPTEAYQAIYTQNGVLVQGPNIIVTVGGTGIDKLSCGASFRTTGGRGTFYAFIQNTDIAGPPSVLAYTMIRGDSSANLVVERHYAILVTHAWRVGDKVFVTLGHGYDPSNDTSELQYTYFLCDSDLKPVGVLERGTATPAENATVGGHGNGLTSVHFYNGQSSWNKFRFHTSLIYRERLDSVNTDQFDEESIKFVELDFLPRLRSAQLGRTTYFAGAQMHTYDGREVVEAGFHLFPENAAAVDSGSAGNLTGQYGYKIRWAHKNAQGEEVVSAALAITSANVAAKKIRVEFPTLPWTRRSDVYALVYRRNPSDTQYYLVSSRDPTATGDNGCPLNDTTATLLSFTDNMANATATTHERDMGNTGELEPFPPPASEVIAAGRDRLWLSGGEIPPGNILPSKLISYGETAQFNTFLTTTVDRASDPITAFGFMGHSVFVFRRDRVYAFEADGPSNLGIGSFDQPRVILADTGAAYPEGMALVDSGLVFVSPAGIRMLATNYQLMDIGQQVKNEVVDSAVMSAVVVPEDEQLRFYRLDGPALVYDLKNREWATWTNLECAGAVRGPTGLAVVGKTNGHLWVETEGLWTDDQLGYLFRVRTAWLHREGLQNFQRVRNVALLGDHYGNHTVTVKAYYDDRDFPEDEWSWNAVGSGDLNTGTWGDSTWGDGVWGDTDDDDTTNFIRDKVYSQRHGLAIQKCARVSFEITDGYAVTEGPAFTALALEVGKRSGLTRLPARTTS